MVIIICGWMAIYLKKEIGERPHLISWHSWLGVAAMTLCFPQVLGGLQVSVAVDIFDFVPHSP